eukprot:TRINITY_DN22847_c0_g1_i1.p1 TRINITY_DN22847_c0_g1~~TRINITY_DN22847_c0_g1_i1.p1  ORF type:complete len:823 (+),score=164.97 TRINITY_DN22847_c0_g1_i1:30-2498(+)
MDPMGANSSGSVARTPLPSSEQQQQPSSSPSAEVPQDPICASSSGSGAQAPLSSSEHQQPASPSSPAVPQDPISASSSGSVAQAPLSSSEQQQQPSSSSSSAVPQLEDGGGAATAANLRLAGEESVAAGKEQNEIKSYQIVVKCIDGSTTNFEVGSHLTGLELKELIATKLEVPADQQRLIFRGRAIQDTDAVGSHITADGQTLHMVQRPGPPPAAAQQEQHASSGSVAQGSSTQPAGGAVPGQAQFGFGAGDLIGPGHMGQVHLQISAVPSGAGQGELGQLLGSLFNAAASAAGRPGPSGSNPAAASSRRSEDRNLFPGQSGTGPSSSDSAAQVGTSPAGTPATASAPGSAPGSSPGPVPGPGPAIPPGAVIPSAPDLSALFAALAGQATGAGQGTGPAGMQPMQVIFQQGLGNLGGAFPGFMAQDFASFPESTQEPTEGGRNRESSRHQGSDGLPWRDLRRLHSHLARVLGRSSSHRPTLPPLQAPQGELVAFLSHLASATAQLNVAINDMQTILNDNGGPSPRQRLQFTMVLASAARALRSLSASMMVPDGLPDTSEGVSREHADRLPSPDDADDDVEDREATDEMPSSSSPQEEQQRHRSAQSSAGTQTLSELVPAVIGEEDLPFEEAEEGEMAEEAEEEETRTERTQEVRDAEAMLMRRLMGESAGSSRVEGSQDILTGLPPEVRSCWERWTPPHNMGRVLEQAAQAPFSRAYVSGDATGTHHTPVLPPPDEFLPLRWERAASRVQGLQETPEHPEHLSRAYLSAFMRDMGQFVGRDATYASIPEASSRYPHLAQLAEFCRAHAPGDVQASAAAASS